MEFDKEQTTSFEKEPMTFDVGEQELLGSAVKVVEASGNVVAEGAKASNPYVYAAVKTAEFGKNTLKMLSNNYKSSLEKEKAERERSGSKGSTDALMGVLVVVVVLLSVGWSFILAPLTYLLQWQTGCYVCKGTGVTSNPSYADSCEYCHGEGSVLIFDGEGGGDYWLTVVEGCSYCGGSGRFSTYRGPDDYEENNFFVAGSGCYGVCRRCHGTGKT